MLTLGDFRFVVATTPALMEGLYRLRYNVYVEEFGFERADDHPNGMEMDEWDPYSIHMVALDTDDQVIGTIRLVLNSAAGLPTLNMVAPFYQDRNPKSRHIGEVSRLAVSRDFRRRAEDGFQADLAAHLTEHVFHKAAEGEFPSQDRRRRFAVVLGLFKIMYHVSKHIDLKDWYMVAEKRLWYMLKRYHIQFSAIGPEMDYHGRRIPYFSHIADVESYMTRASAELMASFKEGLDPKSKGEPAPTSVPSTPTGSTVAPTDSAPLSVAQAGDGVEKLPPPPVSGLYTEKDAEVKARQAAAEVAEIIWPYRIPRGL